MLKLKEVYNRWLKHQEVPGSTGVYLCQDSISMVHVHAVNPARLEILAKQQVVCSTSEEKQAALESFVQKHQLETTTCHALIELQDYKVTLLDTPAVSESEVISSVRWMLKDVINYSLDEACVDIFPIPIQRARDNMKLIYAAVTPLKKILSLESMVKNTRLHLHSLGILELALQKVLSFFGLVNHGSLLIYLQKNIGKLIILDKQHIHMVRNIDIKDNTEETLMLEVQRYLDYANTLFRQNLCSQILIMPNAVLNTAISTQFKATLDIDALWVPFSTFFPDDTMVAVEHQSSLITALGAAISHATELKKDLA